MKRIGLIVAFAAAFAASSVAASRMWDTPSECLERQSQLQAITDGVLAGTTELKLAALEFPAVSESPEWSDPQEVRADLEDVLRRYRQNIRLICDQSDQG